jgi:RNA polymerase sigma-70 factor, ECF subfamily
MSSPPVKSGSGPALPEEEDDVLEQRLLARIARGDSLALEELYRRYATPLYSFVCRMLSDRNDAADMLQECFCRIWKRAHTYEPVRSRPFSWVVMLMRGLCLDRLRQRSTRERGLQRLLDDAENFQVQASTVDNLFFAERCARIRRALESLSDIERRCIELSFFGGVPHGEIAAVLGLPLGTVKSRLRRSLLRLRLILKDWNQRP